MEESLFNELIEKKICKINRVCDLVCIEFGTKDKGDLFLHIQCFFRILKNNRVFVCSDDMCRCDGQYDYETFEWDVPGKSVYDTSINEYKDVLFNPRVINVNKNAIGDLTVVFEDGMCLQIFVDTTKSEEKYRIFNDTSCLVIDS